ncbi:hypothetical protein BC833DRAFT_613084 [Globomyces pollinis-pini]|nr:hypothetical protein BC833DRAFT_613084 [Globomyces pollinis-pini]
MLKRPPSIDTTLNSKDNSQPRTDDTDFTDSLSTRSYLEQEKSKSTGYLSSHDNYSQSDVALKVKTEVSTSFEEMAQKRQSIVGSYLFGTNIGNADLQETVDVISPLQNNLAAQAVSPRPPLPVRTSSYETPAPMVIKSTPSAKTLDRIAETTALSLQLEEDDQKEEQLIQMLSDYEDGFPLLLNRVKETMTSAKEAYLFLKQRAKVESDYAIGLMRLGNLKPLEVAKDGKSKSGTYQTQWGEFTNMHYKLGELRQQFASSISEMSDNIQVLYKNTERSRKQLKEAALRHHKELQDVEGNLEKSRSKFEMASEDLQRIITGSDTGIPNIKKNISNTKPGTNNNPFQMLKQRLQHDLKFLPRTEEEARQKVASTNESYKHWLQQTNVVRNSYFQNHLPRLIRALKETNDDCDEGLQKYLVKYAKCVESLVMVEATTLSPLDQSKEVGLLKTVQLINNKEDFQGFVDSYGLQKKPVDKSEHSYVSYGKTLPVISPYTASGSPAAIPYTSASCNYFGSDLVSLMESSPDQQPVPYIVINCTDYIEASGLSQEGLYRMSGSGTQLQAIRAALDKDPQFPLEDIVTDIHTVTGVIKLFFRELSEPLFPKNMYNSLIDASKEEDSRIRLIKIHELVNELHDANYATLKHLAGHLSRVASFADDNKMNEVNLGIVWGPTLIDSGAGPDPMNMKYASRVVEVIISNFDHIFD